MGGVAGLDCRVLSKRDDPSPYPLPQGEGESYSNAIATIPRAPASPRGSQTTSVSIALALVRDPQVPAHGTQQNVVFTHVRADID